MHLKMSVLNLICISFQILLVLRTIHGEVIFLVKSQRDLYNFTVIIHNETGNLNCFYANEKIELEDVHSDELIENFENLPIDHVLPVGKCLHKLTNVNYDNRCESSFLFFGKKNQLYHYPIKIPKRKTKYIKFLIAQCPSCSLFVEIVEVEHNSTVQIEEIFSEGTKDWIQKQVQIRSFVGDEQLGLVFKPGKAGERPFWAVDDIKHVIFDNISIRKGAVKSFEDMICKLDESKVNINMGPYQKYCRSAKRIGYNCSLDVEEIFGQKSFLEGFKIYESKGWYCPWGFTGNDCLKECHKSFGPHCLIKCPKCEKCNNINGFCELVPFVANLTLDWIGKQLKVSWESRSFRKTVFLIKMQYGGIKEEHVYFHESGNFEKIIEPIIILSDEMYQVEVFPSNFEQMKREHNISSPITKPKLEDKLVLSKLNQGQAILSIPRVERKELYSKKTFLVYLDGGEGSRLVFVGNQSELPQQISIEFGGSETFMKATVFLINQYKDLKETQLESIYFQVKLLTGFYSIFGILGGILLTAFSIGIIFYLRTKNRTKELEDVPLNDIKEKEYKRTIGIDNLESYIFSKQFKETLEEQFKSLPSEPLNDLCDFPHLQKKNKHGNIVPYEYNRVMIETKECSQELYGTIGPGLENYINANFVNGLFKHNKFIITQGPKDSLIVDFWTMIWQNQVEIIVMLTDFLEFGERCSASYWSENSFICKPFIVKTLEKEENEMFTCTKLSLIWSEKTHITKNVLHIKWKWSADNQRPLYPNDVVPLLKYIRSMKTTSPIVVHCSDGVKRTGLYILADLCLDMASDSSKVNFYKLAKFLRKQRYKILEDKKHYELVHLILWESLKVSNSSIDFDTNLSKSISDLLKKYPLEDQLQTLEKLQLIDRLIWINPNYEQIYSIPRYDDKNQLYIISESVSQCFGDFWKLVSKLKIDFLVCFPSNTSFKLYPLQELEEIKISNLIYLKNVGRKKGNGFNLFNLEIVCKDKSQEVLSFPIKLLQAYENLTISNNESKILFEYFFELQKCVQHLSQNKKTAFISNSENDCELFVALWRILDKIEIEGKLDVLTPIRIGRRSNPNYLNKISHLEFLYNAALFYFENGDVYHYPVFN